VYEANVVRYFKNTVHFMQVLEITMKRSNK